jgi:hypothetical protein
MLEGSVSLPGASGFIPIVRRTVLPKSTFGRAEFTESAQEQEKDTEEHAAGIHGPTFSADLSHEFSWGAVIDLRISMTPARCAAA